MRLHENDAECEAFVAAMGARPDDLTAAEHEAVVAVFLERRSMKAAAAHLGVKVSLVKERIGRARRWLRAWHAMRKAA
ncbi:MAG: hypothetical protein JOZ69_03900 [Myxococcales bacterium]|nr:hypothetical protein [Myxococcales bacterium]